MFAPVYECSNCGDIWRVQLIDHIDTERDEVSQELHCENCGNGFLKRKHDNGHPVMHALSKDELDEMTGLYDHPGDEYR